MMGHFHSMVQPLQQYGHELKPHLFEKKKKNNKATK
jgi:hypothetical protein